MISRTFLSLISLFFFLSPSSFAAPPNNPSNPNILFILCDDLGYGDVGVFYQNARAAKGLPAFSTPHLDALASTGLMLTNHYTSSPVCAPARASLMTGQSQGTCTIRDNEFDKPLQPGVLTLADILHSAGYRTAAIGKWGLGGHGAAAEGFPAHPMKRGFDDFFGFMRHGFGHVYYHDSRHPLMDGLTSVRDQYENVYSTDLFTARAKQFITTHHNDHPDQPFFLYLAYTAVHMVLNVPGEPYPPGAGLHGGLQWPLTPTPDTRDTWIHPDYAAKPWTDNMKRYATMARRMDDGVGDILQLLKDLHIDQNTLIIFTSDNGPEYSSGADPRLFSSWGPFDGFKRDVFEGGVREPTIISWPGHIAPHRISSFPCIFYDWMPTLADVAHLPPPAQSDGLSILPTLLSTHQPPHPYLYSEYDYTAKTYPPPDQDLFARKHLTGLEQQQFVRIGNFVALRAQIKSASDPLRLYNVATDPHQDHNLASDPARAPLLKQMTDLLLTARHSDPDAPRPYDDALLPAITLPTTPGKIQVSLYPGSFPYTPNTTSLTPSSTTTLTSLQFPPNLPPSYALEFQGYFNAPTDGTYTFTLPPNTPLQLWIHDAHLFAHEPLPTPDQATLHLHAGLHPLRLIYNHPAPNTPPFTLQYSTPTTPLQPIPSTLLSIPNPQSQIRNPQ